MPKTATKPAKKPVVKTAIGVKERTVVSLDTETTGLDLRYGAKPYCVTSCDPDLNVTFWEWPVDPKTREPKFPPGDLAGVVKLIETADELVFHNAKFDIKALDTLKPGLLKKWPWEKTHDTLIAAHILESAEDHNLTDLCVRWLGVNIQKYEDALNDVTEAARRWCRSHHKDWQIAAKGRADMPSAKEKIWKADGWLPKALWQTDKDFREKHPEANTVLSEYANADSPVTIRLWEVFKKELHRRDLWPNYLARMKMVRVLTLMEEHGVTINRDRLEAQREEYTEESEKCERVMVNIAKSYGHDLTVGKGVTNSLRVFMWDVLKLPTVAETDSGQPSMAAEALETYLLTLDDKTKPWLFVKNLADKRKRDTALTYMDSYEKFALPVPGLDFKKWFKINPTLNPTGTRTTRLSSSNPNEQSISKKKGFNLRLSFGPAPGRVWYSCDAENIELRLPMYKCGEEAMVALFENPTALPYRGSNHLLIAHVLHKEKFEACLNKDGKVDGEIFKERYPDLYKRVKNGNFAVQYGAIESSGTADRAYGVPGGQRLVQQRFTKQAKMNADLIAFANKNGYVETMPRKSVNPRRGYPLQVPKSWGGKVEPTKPLNYYIQGSAGEWMEGALVRCQGQLDEWEADHEFDGHLIISVHDELVFDFPEYAVDEPWRMEKMREHMRKGGDEVGIPLPASCELHRVSWAEGEKIK